ncbi:hypothetical protein ACIG3E_35645 [Streptomyces sp. NPDC053474]|uniref:hypothetical protein n=1 Tax=Streptomyces sp. NPDC053474 TaxID=3365704 RepID=UPI0037D6A333
MVTTHESHDVDPYAAVEELRAVLAEAGIVFPSLAVDHASPSLGLVNLGRVRAEVAMRLAQQFRREGRE